jgi:hypothetical protein
VRQLSVRSTVAVSGRETVQQETVEIQSSSDINVNTCIITPVLHNEYTEICQLRIYTWFTVTASTVNDTRRPACLILYRYNINYLSIKTNTAYSLYQSLGQCSMTTDRYLER